MQLTEVSAKTGYVWFRQGLWLFRRNPFSFLTLLILYMIVAALVVQIPVPGAIVLPLLFMPGFAAGFMAACRETVAGNPVLPTLLFDGFTAHGKRAAQRLLLLGVLYVVVLLLLGSALLIVALKTIDNNLLLQIARAGMIQIPDKNSPATSGILYAVLRVMLIGLVGQIMFMLVTLLLWFAAVVSAWHDASPAKAIFFGVIGTWRNRGAFIVHGALWYAVLTAVSLLPSVMSAAGINNMLHIQMVMMPVMLVVVTMICCSLYAAYRGCFSMPQQEQESSPKVSSTGDS